MIGGAATKFVVDPVAAVSAAGAEGRLCMVFSLLSKASISLASRACSAPSKKSAGRFPSVLALGPRAEFFCLEVVLLVPATCLKGQSSFKHSRDLSDCGHIFGWNS